MYDVRITCIRLGFGKPRVQTQFHPFYVSIIKSLENIIVCIPKINNLDPYVSESSSVQRRETEP